jgi:hypothetical protein
MNLEQTIIKNKAMDRLASTSMQSNQGPANASEEKANSIDPTLICYHLIIDIEKLANNIKNHGSSFYEKEYSNLLSQLMLVLDGKPEAITQAIQDIEHLTKQKPGACSAFFDTIASVVLGLLSVLSLGLVITALVLTPVPSISFFALACLTIYGLIFGCGAIDRFNAARGYCSFFSLSKNLKNHLEHSETGDAICPLKNAPSQAPRTMIAITA